MPARPAHSDQLADHASSHPGAALHFGCLSPLEVATGARARRGGNELVRRPPAGPGSGSNDAPPKPETTPRVEPRARLVTHGSTGGRTSSCPPGSLTSKIGCGPVVASMALTGRRAAGRRTRRWWVSPDSSRAGRPAGRRASRSGSQCSAASPTRRRGRGPCGTRRSGPR